MTSISDLDLDSVAREIAASPPLRRSLGLDAAAVRFGEPTLHARLVRRAGQRSVGT